MIRRGGFAYSQWLEPVPFLAHNGGSRSLTWLVALCRLLQRRERYAKSFEMAPRRVLILILKLGYEPTTNKALSPFGVAQPAVEQFGSEKEFDRRDISLGGPRVYPVPTREATDFD